MKVRLAPGSAMMAMAALAGCAQVAPPAPAPVAAPAPGAAADTPPAGMQYLYGSAEAAAISQQAYAALIGHVRALVKARPADSVVLARDSTLAAPHFVPCGDKPFAAVFDVDETLLLNLGFEYHDARRAGGPYDPAAWERFERTGAATVAPIPGAVAMADALRGLGVTVIFNTNRSAANAQPTAEALRRAGLGPAVHGETLFLKGDDADGSGKDGRRATISATYCVIAMGGDQLGDFSDLFMAERNVPRRRALAAQGPITQMWGRGWFLLPNPVYGAALRGSFDDVFPADKRWVDPTQGE